MNWQLIVVIVVVVIVVIVVVVVVVVVVVIVVVALFAEQETSWLVEFDGQRSCIFRRNVSRKSR